MKQATKQRPKTENCVGCLKKGASLEVGYVKKEGKKVNASFCDMSCAYQSFDTIFGGYAGPWKEEYGIKE